MTGTARRFGVVFALTCLTSLPAAAMPRVPSLWAPSGVGRAMMVCTADGCRHRFRSYRARPAWNAYMMREHPPEPEAATPAATPTGPGAARRGEHRR